MSRQNLCTTRLEEPEPEVEPALEAELGLEEPAVEMPSAEADGGLCKQLAGKADGVMCK